MIEYLIIIYIKQKMNNLLIEEQQTFKYTELLTYQTTVCAQLIESAVTC